jgi:hypothetical protein
VDSTAGFVGVGGERGVFRGIIIIVCMVISAVGSVLESEQLDKLGELLKVSVVHFGTVAVFGSDLCRCVEHASFEAVETVKGVVTSQLMRRVTPKLGEKKGEERVLGDPEGDFWVRGRVVSVISSPKAHGHREVVRDSRSCFGVVTVVGRSRFRVKNSVGDRGNISKGFDRGPVGFTVG